MDTQSDKLTNLQKKIEKPVTINIIGSCVSRDIFNIERGVKYDVGAYIFHISLFTLFYNVDSRYKIEQSEVNDLSPHNFIRRMICTSVNSDAPEQLLNRKGEWVILDTYCADLPVSVINYPDQSSRLIQSGFNHLVDKLFNRDDKFRGCRINHIDASVNMAYYIRDVAKFLKENWGNNIILINSSSAFIEIDENGAIQIDYRSYLDTQQRSNKMVELILNNLDCHYIEMPNIVIRDFLKGGMHNRVHYISELTEY